MNVFEFDGEVIVRSLIDVAHKYLVPKKTERKLSIHDIETRDAWKKKEQRIKKQMCEHGKQ